MSSLNIAMSVPTTESASYNFSQNFTLGVHPGKVVVSTIVWNGQSKEENTTTIIVPPAADPQHDLIRCDLCKVIPITGLRYVSLRSLSQVSVDPIALRRIDLS